MYINCGLVIPNDFVDRREKDREIWLSSGECRLIDVKLMDEKTIRVRVGVRLRLHWSYGVE